MSEDFLSGVIVDCSVDEQHMRVLAIAGACAGKIGCVLRVAVDGERDDESRHGFDSRFDSLHSVVVRFDGSSAVYSLPGNQVTVIPDDPAFFL